MFEIHIISLFGESIRPYLDSSIMKRAQEKGLFRYYIHNLADWTVKNTRRVDDRPYGGGAGTLITIEPITNCLREIQIIHGNMPILYVSPKGEKLEQKICNELVHSAQKYIIICGHYEGIDARIFDIFNIREISIGDYVLSSGELASLVIIDSIVRLIPGVLSEESLKEESFSSDLDGKKEYPQYSRPETFEGITVPKILLSGDLKKIQEWKYSNLS
ncbi:tRNA (guanosine(37)-N1)-methyltransferase TrmD [Candidatus Gracilibacteria bacterium]|nr:tRNA (guanosine(37)-N1)-methyltransferase TrmD [Candidatus Gracilibacteria bacterium]